MEVVSHAEYMGLALWDPLDLVCPLSRDLDSCLNGLGTSVHGQHHIIAEEVADLCGPYGEHIIVKGSRAQREATSLLSQGFDQLRVTVALVDGAVGREEIEIVLALWIPDVDSLGAGKDNGNGVVIVGSILVLRRDGGFGRGGMEPGRSGGGVTVGGGGCHDGSDGVSPRGKRRKLLGFWTKMFRAPQ